MRRWVVHKPAPQPYFTDETFDLLTYTKKREPVTGSPWLAVSGLMADVRRKVKQDLVDDPGLPDMIFTKSAVVAAELQAEFMEEKIEDIVVTLVIKARFSDSVGTIRVESIRYSQLVGRIEELNLLAKKGGGTVFIVTAYSEVTGQEFWWNDLEIDEEPRLPGYSQEYERKRKAYRTPSDGVIR